MKWHSRFGAELIAIIAMIVVVFILAVYQYRWTGEISRTEQARLKNSLATSVRNFDQEFSYDFQQLCASLELDPETKPSDLEAHASRQLAGWQRTGAHAPLVSGLWIWKGSPTPEAIESLSRNDPEFRPALWPSELESLRGPIHHQLQQAELVSSDREALYYAWTFYSDGPALVRPIFRIVPGERRSGQAVSPIGMLIVKLNSEYLASHYLPDLVDRQFGAAGQRSFVVAVRTSQPPYRTVYISDTNFSLAAGSSDATVNLFDLVGEESRRRGHAPLQSSAPGEQWQLIAQHPSGSLEEAVASWRRRNLAISLGLLVVLAASMALIFTSARRSRALARMQMEFVAGVSHELCTPLAVINTAADNLADGVVENAVQMQEYGSLIRGQGRRLERLVDEVLLFTAGRFGLSGYRLERVEVAEIIAQGLATSESNLREAGFEWTKSIEDNLPPIVADASAVITCIENVVSNAIKYSNSNKWLAIRATAASSESKMEVRISVADKGIGIAPEDLPHIFEPFYRVPSVRDHQIRGVGLGLYLVKRMMEEMGGRVSVTSELGRGTTVVLHFVAAGNAEQSSAEPLPEVQDSRKT